MHYVYTLTDPRDNQVRYVGKPIIAFGGVYYVPLHPFHDCSCERCQQLYAITVKRLATMQT
jgi:hypothetical protein